MTRSNIILDTAKRVWIISIKLKQSCQTEDAGYMSATVERPGAFIYRCAQLLYAATDLFV